MKLIIKEAAQDDILSQVERYAQQGLFDIAWRFHEAVMHGIDAAQAMPSAGSPRFLKNPSLHGLRTWPVSGFDAFKIYYLASSDDLAVVRILHGRRDIEGILDDEPPLER